RQGVNFKFPVPDACPNPECLIPIPPKKHGFYERNCLDVTYRDYFMVFVPPIYRICTINSC
ncbi:MAG: hypothetical protein PHU69_13125, partial [Fermentimonas sp.]|nr:hypothetical protein [Fermentimonas sp.]